MGMQGLPVSLACGRSLVQTSVTVTSASTAIVAANPGRTYLAIQNSGGQAVTLGFDAAATSTGWSVAATGGTMVWEGAGVHTGALNGIAASGNNVVLVLEGIGG